MNSARQSIGLAQLSKRKLNSHHPRGIESQENSLRSSASHLNPSRKRSTLIPRQTSTLTSHLNPKTSISRNSTTDQVSNLSSNSSLPSPEPNLTTVVTIPRDDRSSSPLYTEPLPSLQNSEKKIIVPGINSTQDLSIKSSENQARQRKADQIGWIGGLSVCLIAFLIAIGICLRQRSRKRKRNGERRPSLGNHAAFWANDGSESDHESSSKTRRDTSISLVQPISSPQESRLMISSKKTEISSAFEDEVPKTKPLMWLKPMKAFSIKPALDLQSFQNGGKAPNRQLDTIQMEQKNRQKQRSSLSIPQAIHMPPSLLDKNQTNQPPKNDQDRIQSKDLMDRGSFCPTDLDHNHQSVICYPLNSYGYLDLASPPLDHQEGHPSQSKDYVHYTLPPAKLPKPQPGIMK